jgi:hypothetical protein
MTTGGSVDKRSSPAGSNDAGTRGTVNATGSVGGGAAGVLQEITGAVSRSQIRDIVVNDSVGISVNNNFGELYGARISGFVYTEKGAANSNYQIGADWPLPGATLTLTGTNDAGQAINQSLVSDSNGSYSFAGLRPGTYQVARSNPAGITDEVGGAYPGTDASLAVHGVRVTDDLINAITVGSNTIISNTNFAVVNGPAPAPVPTLSEWAKVMLAALLVVSVGFLQVRSRHCGRW